MELFIHDVKTIVVKKEVLTMDSGAAFEVVSISIFRGIKEKNEIKLFTLSDGIEIITETVD